MKNKNKLIMFDYGNIIEKLSNESEVVYDYRDVFADAAVYATGIVIPDDWDWEKIKGEIVDSISQSRYTEMEFKGWDCTEKRLRYLASALQELPFDIKCDFLSAAERYTWYVKTHSRLVPLNMEMINVEKRAGEKCLIGAMTNIGTTWVDCFREKTKDIKYDYVFESCEAGVVKPNSASYEKVEAMTGLRGKQILLIDDNFDNIEAAINNGWCGYWVPRINKCKNIESVIDDFIADDENAMYWLTSIPVR